MGVGQVWGNGNRTTGNRTTTIAQQRGLQDTEQGSNDSLEMTIAGRSEAAGYVSDNKDEGAV